MLLLTTCFTVAGQDLQPGQPVDQLAALQESKPDTGRLRIYHKLAKYYLDQYPDNKNAVDSASRFLKKAIALSDDLGNDGVYGKNESLCRLAETYMKAKDLPAGRKLFLTAIRNYRQKHDTYAEARTWYVFSLAFEWNAIHFNEMLDYDQKSLALYLRSPKKDEAMNPASRIALIHEMQNKRGLGDKELLAQLEMARRYGIKRVAFTYMMLAQSKRYQGKLNTALFYAYKAVKNIDEYGDPGYADYIYGELALIYRELGQTKESIEWFGKTLLLRRQIQSEQYIVYRTAGFLIQEMIKGGQRLAALAVISQLGKTSPPVGSFVKGIEAQNLAYCYQALKRYKLAEMYFLKMSLFFTEIKYDKEIISTANQDIGQFYVETRQYAKSVRYLTDAMDAAPLGSAILSRVKNIHLLLFKADSALKDYPNAIEHFRQYKILNDSIYNIQKSKQIEELQIKYETAKKEQNIKLLRDESRGQQQKLTLTLAGILVLIIFVALLYYSYAKQHRSNRKLEKQQKAINRINRSLKDLLSEKEWLLKEVHHRVKNNLQTVMSLLNSQSVYLKDDSAIVAIRDSQHRIHAMSLIHQKLYNSENVSSIDMPVYIQELVAYLLDSFTIGQRIRFEMELEPIELDVSQAIPLGIIINEAITNSFKYAFPSQREGIIKVGLKHLDEGKLLLSIADNGIGLPEAFENSHFDSLGMSLMTGLTEDIDGEFFIENDQGTVIKIVFVYEETLGQLLSTTAKITI